tara:strand:+ start:2630 stop:2959 length:330 start_codon:yes stop_codon:yes gene_type:complete
MKKIFLLLISVFCFLTSHTQITVKHFNADWNESNTVTWLGKLTDCTTKYYDITKYPALQKKYRVVVVPTIIVFQDGEEIKRYQANIMMQVEAKREEIQELIDESIMSGF